MDFANELNVYFLLVRSVYNYVAVKKGGSSVADFKATCEKIEKIFDESIKVDLTMKTQMSKML